MVIRSLCHKLINTGVYADTPEILTNRILLSNLVCLLGFVFCVVFGAVNLYKGYYFLLGLDIFYLIGEILCLELNRRRHYVSSRLILSSAAYFGMLAGCLYQGRVAEMEHFFIPFAITGFCFFTYKERIYSFAYMAFCLAAYLFMMAQDAPLISGNTMHFTDGDRIMNRIGYIVMYAVFLYALSSAFDRAMQLITDQKAKLFEERKMAVIGSMACNVAHEINSPLAALDLHLYQLDALMKSNSLTPEEAERRLQKMVGISRRISVIVRGLKFLSRQDDNDPIATRSVKTIVESALDLNRDRIEANNIRFQVNMETPEDKISCRPVALSQVFLNLLNNAVDAVQAQSTENRWISITSRRKLDFIEISVEDGGAIISEETRANLFKTFYTTKPVGKGTGLGLSISRETVEAHRGSLIFDEDSQHTRFVVELPIGPARSPEEGCA